MWHQIKNSLCAEFSVTSLYRNLSYKCRRLFSTQTKIQPEMARRIFVQSADCANQAITRPNTILSSQSQNQQIIPQNLEDEQLNFETETCNNYVDQELGHIRHIPLETNFNRFGAVDQLHSMHLGVLQYQPPVELESLESETTQPAVQANVEGGKKSDFSIINYCSFIAMPTHLQNHINMMFYIGLSPIKGNGKLGSRLHMVRFALTTAAGLFDAFGDFKGYIVDNAKTGNMFHYITIWHYIGLFLIQLYILKLFTLSYRSIASILSGSPNKDSNLQLTQFKPKISKTSLVYVSVVLLMAFATAIRVDWMLDGDTFTDILLSRSHLVSVHILYWEKDSINRNQTEELAIRFGTDLSAGTLAMGIFGCFSVLFGNLQKDLTRDILLMVALDVYKMSQCFKSYALEHLNEGNQIAIVLSKLKQMHTTFADMSNQIDYAFGNFFIFMHADNLLFCSYFLLDMLQANTESIYFVESFIFIPKILCAYYVSAKIIKLVDEVESSLVEAFDKSTSPGVKISRVNLYLRKLKTHPIGIGRGEFLLDETFGLNVTTKQYLDNMQYAIDVYNLLPKNL